jgi:hypothetical protein
MIRLGGDHNYYLVCALVQSVTRTGAASRVGGRADLDGQLGALLIGQILDT